MEWLEGAAGTFVPGASLQRLEILNTFDLARQHGLVVIVEIPIQVDTRSVSDSQQWISVTRQLLQLNLSLLPPAHCKHSKGGWRTPPPGL